MDDSEIKGYRDPMYPDYNFSGVYFRIRKDKNEVAIINCDYISNYTNKLKRKFMFENILGLKITKNNEEKYGECYELKTVENLIDEIIFSKWLHNNYFTEVDKLSINNGYLKSNLIIARETLGNWFFKGNKSGVEKVLDKTTLNIIKGNITEGYIPKARTQFNLRWSIKQYFGGEIRMADFLKEIKSTVRIKINASVTESIESDKEYYFAVGQLVYYFISKSKGQKKPYSLTNPFINAKNNNVIKENLKRLYKKYDYDIEIKDRRFKNLYGMILGYNPKAEVDQDMIIAGTLQDSLIYESNK